MANNEIIDVTDNKEAGSVFESLLKTRDLKYFFALDKYLKNNRKAIIFYELESVDGLDINVGDETLAEYIVDNADNFGYDVKGFLVSNIDLIKTVIGKKKYELLNFLNEEMLYQEYENGKNLFEFLLDHDLLTEKIVELIRDENHIDLIAKLMDKDEMKLTWLNQEILNKFQINGVSALEYLFQKGLANVAAVQKYYSISSQPNVFDLCVKYKRDDLLPYLREGVLSQEKNGKLVIDYLIEKNILPNPKGLGNVSDIGVIKSLINHGLFQYFARSFEFQLLKKINDEKTLLEIMFENGQTPLNSNYEKKESLYIILKYRRYDLLHNVNTKLLLESYDDSNTFLDTLLDAKKQGMYYNISSIPTYYLKNDELAKFYIIIAKHGYINYVNFDSWERYILKNNGEFLTKLLEFDRELTVKTILPSIPRLVMENPMVGMILRMNGIDQKNARYDFLSMSIVKEYYKQFNEQFMQYKLEGESRDLIDEFRNLMLSDGLSDPELVEAMITSYTYLIATNNVYGINELKNLIEIKRKIPNFAIKRDKDNSYFRPIDNTINLENVGLDTLNHETGHALYHLLAGAIVPDNFYDIIKKIRSNPDTIRKIANYSVKFHEIESKVAQYVDEHYMKNYQISAEEMAKIDEFLNKQKEDCKKEYLGYGYDEDTIDILLRDSYTKEEYIEQDKRVKREELIDAVLRTKYGSFIAIGDLIDAIYEGKFRSKELRNNYGNVIKPGYGHGIAYYSKGVDWAFDETMANYSSIMKSKDANEIVNYIRELFGEEYFNLISNYYTNEIALSTGEIIDSDDKSK